MAEETKDMAAVDSDDSDDSEESDEHGLTKPKQWKEELPDIFSLMDALVSPNRLDMELSEEEIKMIVRFEVGWMHFLNTNSDMIPRGKRGSQFLPMKHEIHNTVHSMAAAETELQKQLRFFESSRERLEAKYQAELAIVQQEERHVRESIQEKLDLVNEAHEIMLQTVPWNHFLDSLEFTIGEHGNEKRSTKPSQRALYLIQNDNEEEGEKRSEEEIKLHAYRVDNAILRAQVRMLEREIERYQKTSQSLEGVATFFTEYNIWGILTKQQTNSTAIRTAMSPLAPTSSMSQPNTPKRP